MFKRQDLAFRYESEMACVTKPRPSPSASPTTSMTMSISAYPSLGVSSVTTELAATPSVSPSLSISLVDVQSTTPSCKLRTKRLYSVREDMFGFHIVCRCASGDDDNVVVEKRVIGAPSRRDTRCVLGCIRRVATTESCGDGTSGMSTMTENCCSECMTGNGAVDVERRFRIGKRRMTLYRCKTV